MKMDLEALGVRKSRLFALVSRI